MTHWAEIAFSISLICVRWTWINKQILRSLKQRKQIYLLHVYTRVLSCFACSQMSAPLVARKAQQRFWRIACLFLEMSGACNVPQNMGGWKYFFVFDEILSPACVVGREMCERWRRHCCHVAKYETASNSAKDPLHLVAPSHFTCKQAFAVACWEPWFYAINGYWIRNEKANMLSRVSDCYFSGKSDESLLYYCAIVTSSSGLYESMHKSP